MSLEETHQKILKIQSRAFSLCQLYGCWAYNQMVAGSNSINLILQTTGQAFEKNTKLFLAISMDVKSGDGVRLLVSAEVTQLPEH